MNGGNKFNWKAAALPLAAFTALAAAGIHYFVGGGGDQAPAQGAASAFKFDSGPQYAPGSQAARAQAAGQQGSSIDLFRETNKGYAKEEEADRPVKQAAAKPKGKKEMAEFMRQVRADIDFDPAAAAAAQAQGLEQGAQGGRSITNPLRPGAGQQEQQATAVTQRQSQSRTAQGRAGSLASRKSAFSAGRVSAGLSPGGGSRPGQLRSIGGGSADASTSQSTDSDFNMLSGGGRLESGEYGSHGGRGGGGSQDAGMSGGSPSGASTSGGGIPRAEEKLPPAPVAFVWQRSVDFGTMYMYETSARQVIVMNIGDAALKIGKISNLDDETPFYLEKDKCSNASLQPGKSCTFRVRFSPRAVREYLTGFEIPSNDDGAMAYQSYIEVKGNSKYSYSTWWWHNYWSGSAGLNNRLNFGMVPEGYKMEQVLRITNSSGSDWEGIKLDRKLLPADFKLSSDQCTGSSLGPRQSCQVTVTFEPTAAGNKKFSSGYYGQYHSVNMTTGAKLFHSRPKFPPLVLEKPVEAAPKGKLRVIANYHALLKTGHTVLEVPVEALSSAPFPVTGLLRVQHYYYFK